jgi:Fe-S cluster biosynthesis and repair protein YggX
MVKCAKLNREAAGLTFVPYPGELGQKIYHHISEEAWNEWINYLTRLINEKRLDVADPQVKESIESQMKDFLFLEENNA